MSQSSSADKLMDLLDKKLYLADIECLPDGELDRLIRLVDHWTDHLIRERSERQRVQLRSNPLKPEMVKGPL